MLILVTGARGFVGHGVIRHLALLRHTVIGLGHGAWPEGEFRHLGLSDWINGDVSHANLDLLSSRYGCPDAVIHLAGGSSVGASFAAPAEDFARSVAGATVLADWIRLRSPCTRVVLASSAAVYGAGHIGFIREDSACRPFSPYGFHKRMTELVFESYAKNFGLKVAIVRLFSVYGPELRKQLLWDSCVRLSDRGALDLGGTGEEVRDWLHIDDAAKILILAIPHADSTCLILNGGTGIATPIKDIAEQLCISWGEGIHARFSGNSRAGDPARLVADISQIVGLGFECTRNWAEGLREYVEWYKATNGVIKS